MDQLDPAGHRSNEQEDIQGTSEWSQMDAMERAGHKEVEDKAHHHQPKQGEEEEQD